MALQLAAGQNTVKTINQISNLRYKMYMHLNFYFMFLNVELDPA